MKYHDLLNEWIDFHSLSISESSALNYSRNMARVNDELGKKKISEISTKNIQDFFVKYHREGYARNTLINFSKIISMSFKYAESMCYITNSPYVNIIIPKGYSKDITPYTVDEVRSLLEVPMQLWVRDSIEVAYRTGMRKGEVFAIAKQDINLKKQFLIVNHTQSLTKNGIILCHPKTKYSRRRIDFDEYVLEIFERRLFKNDSDFVFSRNGEMIIPWSLPNTIKNKCKLAGIQPHTFHDLRHGHATFLLENNVHPKIVQERLGHSSISVTLDTYSHLVPGLQKVAVDITNNLSLF